MGTVIVTGTFTVSWDTDTYRRDWKEAEDLSDQDILDECRASVQENWSTYATDPDTMDVFGELAA